jgi:holo-[acyl-carrier protein] synthase
VPGGWLPGHLREAALVLGLGIDLVETARIERALARFGSRLVGRLMDPDEAERLPAGAPERSVAVALAVAAKEAASKALGTGWSHGVAWRQVVVTLGPPASIVLRGRAGDVARRIGSSGRTWIGMELRGELAWAEVWLLS